ncbi:hypothetical protein KY285_022807 [Solanum tuberosum]|nr:hypothetical protein KY285_022807 [Solanum tuberosum]
MAAACFSAIFLMFHLLIFNLVKVESKLSCPKEFNCGRLGTMSYPFSEFNKPYCGLSKIDCNNTFQYPKVEIEGVTYNAYKKWLWVNGIDLSDSILESYLANRSCKSFERNLSFPDTPSISFGVFDNITLFKCMNGSTNEEIGGYFRRYEKYLNCDGFNLYYHKPRTDHRNYSIPVDDDDLPANCSIIRLPLKYISPSVPVPHDLFELLSSNFTLDWEVSKDCSTCIHREGQCQSDSKNDFFFSKAKAAKRYLGLILGIGSFAVFSCIGIVILLFCFREKILWYKCLRFWESNAQDHQRVEEFLKNYGSYAPNRYNYTDIKRITGRFRNKLGQGGFGNVYRGSLRDGSQVAVKVLNELNGSGEDFINEVASCSRTSHVNIVRLVGFCFEGHKRALIYEFMPNGSLEKFIYEERSDGVRQLGWPILYEISLGIARGLEYLHRGCNTRILHFDIKPHNILLDEDFCPKISDFGLAKLCIKKESVVSMLGPRGTIGYIAPEVVCRNLGGVSHKSDVYSYGMMVLEMVGGRKNVDVGVDRTSEIYFPHWLYRRIELDEELQLIGIMNEEENDCARKMVIASLWCIQTDPANRPSMSKVVEILEGKLDSLQMPPKPYLYSPSRPEAKGNNDSTCPKSFSCGNFTDLTFPYSLPTQADCGIMFLSDCDDKTFPRIQLVPGGEWYFALEMHNSSVWIEDTKLQTTLRQHKCQAFNKNFSLPNSPFMSFHIININNFFKCISTSNNARNITQKKNNHFAGYNMYNGCEGFSIYYNFSEDVDEYIGADNLPTNCSLIRLPIHSSHGDLFNMLGPEILIEWKLKNNLWYKYLRFWESNAEDHQKVEEFLKNYGSYAPNRYNYTDIKRITGRFRSKLGQGGFGNVYRGSLSNGSEVAVKVLKELKGSAEDFVNEVASISRTSLVNIVSLMGFCFEGQKRALVYEFMPNGSLEKFIYEERSNGVHQLGWPILYKIALGIARGLEYLHRGCNTRILHFDIKPHNILLDDNFYPKISDFGLAKLNLGGVSHKSDVYSYGMMVLEMVGGRKNVDVGVDRTSEIYFPHWLYQRLELDEELQLVGIMNEEENECARKMVIASLWCIQTDPSNRPSMSKVVEMLEGKLDSLQRPPKP